MCESVWERKIQKYDQYQRSYNSTPKGILPEREPGKTNACNESFRNCRNDSIFDVFIGIFVILKACQLLFVIFLVVVG